MSTFLAKPLTCKLFPWFWGGASRSPPLLLCQTSFCAQTTQKTTQNHDSPSSVSVVVAVSVTVSRGRRPGPLSLPSGGSLSVTGRGGILPNYEGKDVSVELVGQSDLDSSERRAITGRGDGVDNARRRTEDGGRRTRRLIKTEKTVWSAWEVRRRWTAFAPRLLLLPRRRFFSLTRPRAEFDIEAPCRLAHVTTCEIKWWKRHPFYLDSDFRRCRLDCRLSRGEREVETIKLELNIPSLGSDIAVDCFGSVDGMSGRRKRRTSSRLSHSLGSGNNHRPGPFGVSFGITN